MKSYEKFMKLDEEKRTRIINAAMKEFCYGYKKASTDAIVREARISKGLLFHYFGTKENLFEFIVLHAQDVMQSEYIDLLNLGNQDVLEAMWQGALLRKDISDKYPYIHDFSKGIHAHIVDMPNSELFLTLMQENEEVFKELLRNSDTSLLRDDIDPRRALPLIMWALDGFFEYSDVKENIEGESEASYEVFLEELREYLDVIRLCFYKNHGGKK